MGQRFLIDTNTLIDFQSSLLPKNGLEYVSKIIDGDFIISFITYIEFLGYRGVTQKMEDFAALADVIEINKNIIDQTILIRKKYNIKLPDAIIAATAIVYDFTLVSHNTKDFLNISDLKMPDAYEV